MRGEELRDSIVARAAVAIGFGAIDRISIMETA